MSTPKPGEIRCPTCHRSTVPAAFCTQCGSTIPSDARIRPRGLDRDELQDRIRARRSGADPYRRGAAPDDSGPAYERFEPEPEDATTRRARRQDVRRRDEFHEPNEPVAPVPVAPTEGSAPPPAPPPADRPDVTREHDDWVERRPVAPVPPPPMAAVEELEHVDHYDDSADDAGDYPYEYDEWDDDRNRRSPGAGAFAVLGFLGLGVLALLGGAVLAGVFSGDPNTGGVNPAVTRSPTISATASETAEPSSAPSTDPSVNPSGDPGASGDPVVFPDGFSAEAQPCIPGSPNVDGCDSNAVSNNGNLWVWVGFANGTENDVIGVEITGPDGTTVGDGSIPLARIGCSPRCPGGWTYFPFGGLGPGTYDVEVTRNGDRAGTTSFEVS
ncbi:MAG: hypothetical protein ABIW50_05560 [Candidatus Limnocylindria bacterium]